MTDFFGIPMDTLTRILLGVTIVILAGVLILALSNLIFFKIGARNLPRRRGQMLLIVFALMLSTTLLTSVLATGNVITATVQTVAISNLGNIDETVEGGHGDIGLFDQWIYDHLRQNTRENPDISAMAAALVERNLLLADVTSRQVHSQVSSIGLLAGSEQGFGGLLDATHSSLKHRISELKQNEVFINHTLAQLINAHAGDTLYLYSQRWPGKRYKMHVKAIVQDGGLVGQVPFVISNIQTFRAIEHVRDDLNYIYVENGRSATSSQIVQEELEYWLPRDIVQVINVKQQGIQSSQS